MGNQVYVLDVVGHVKVYRQLPTLLIEVVDVMGADEKISMAACVEITRVLEKNSFIKLSYTKTDEPITITKAVLI